MGRNQISWERKETPGTLIVNALVGQPTVALCAVMVVVGLIAWIDHMTGPLLALSAVYLLPIGVAAWARGTLAGLVAAAAVSLAALMANKAAEPLAGTPMLYWNAFVRFGIFALATVVGESLMGENAFR